MLNGENILLLILRGILIFLLNQRAFLLAYTFGDISPIRTSKKVMTTTCSRKLTNDSSGNEKTFEVRYDDKIIIAIFIKLFDIRIFAKSLLGFSRSFRASTELLDLSFFKCSISFGDREKYATSEPDINAEQKSNKIIIDSIKKTLNDNGINVISRML